MNASLSSQPATPDTLAVPTMTPELQAKVEAVFASQRKTALALRASTAKQRIEKLRKLRDVIMDHREAIADAAAKDFGRTATEAEFGEMMPVLMDIADQCKHLKKWLKPRKVAPTAFMLGSSAEVRYEPRGRCLIIAPWNYPVTLALGPLVPAIASGNTVMLKTSEMAPHFSKVLVSIVQATFEENEVAIFEGDVSVATALLELPFDHCFFTGAPTIGKVVMGAAAKNLTSVTLELGGKSPTIIDEHADVDMAVKTIAWGKFINSGQTCIAPDHIYVHNKVRAEFEQKLVSQLTEWYGKDGKAGQPLAQVINSRHADRVFHLIEDAVAKNAKVLHGGQIDRQTNFISPTVLTDISSDAEIMQQEIFGPLLPIIPFDDVESVIDKINDAPKPLALYIWTKKQAVADRIIENTSAGGTCVNHISAHFLHHNLPFGGVNNSGIGSCHGEWGIRAFSHERAIVRTKIMTAKMFFPSKSNKTQTILNWLFKYLMRA